MVQLCGGIGLFLLGMTLMTDSLKEIAGEQLRVWLSRFTGSPSKALWSGIGFTLAVQSSTATTLATIGFVGAGVLSFSQAIGVIIGANIGTTSTGWMVAFLGVKFSITNIALPMIALGAVCKLLSKGRLALIGTTVAGFGLLFYGIDLLQVAMSGFAERVDLAQFSSPSLATQLLLVLIGIIITILLQSSSAAVTATLAALASGAIDISQALGLVIGQNIGTVATAVLAVIGSTVNAQRTALVHVIFNLIAALLAFIILKPIFLWLYQQHSWVSMWDHVVVVAAFHTAFSVFGALCLMPFIRQLEAAIVTLLPDQDSSILSYLNTTSLSVPSLAIQAANQVMQHALGQIFAYLKLALQDAVLPSRHQLQKLDEMIDALQRYLADIPMSEHAQERQQLTNLLRMMVYLDVLRSDLNHIEYSALLRTQPQIYQVALDYLHILDHQQQFLQNPAIEVDFQQLNLELLDLKQSMEQQREQMRQALMQYASTQHLSASKSLELLAAQRWLDRLIAHTQRFTNVVNESQHCLEKQQTSA